MTFSLLHIRKRLATPLAWLMVLAMLSPLSPHLVEGVALCIGEDHVGVEATGASHHSNDGRVAPLAPINTKDAASQPALLPFGHAPSAPHAVAGASETPSPSECSDVPLRVVRSGDACYQAVQTGGGPDVPPLLASQMADFAHAGETSPSAPTSGARESRISPRATVPSASPLSSSTVVLLI